MVNVIIYSMDEIDFCKLKNFKYHNFTLTAYGKLDNTWWCVYGNYDFEMYYPEAKRYEGIKAYEHFTKKSICSAKLLDICDAFGTHVGSCNTDIEVDGVGNGSLIGCVSSNIANLSSGENINNGKKYLIYRK